MWLIRVSQSVYKLFLIRSLLLISVCMPLSVMSQEPEGQDPVLATSGAMTQDKMAIIIAELAGEYEGTLNSIQFVYNDVVMVLISDNEMNRMRIIAPITEVDNLTDSHLKAAMVSNYHLALDARYAIGNGVLYAAYIHPLKELTKEQLESAVRQVSSLRLSFGTTYSSGELTYGVRNPEEQDI